jgi:hypothetical protein
MLTSMGLQRDPDRFLSQSKETLSEPDGQLLDQPELAKLFVAGLQEAFRSGVGGANRDATLYTKPWGFRLQELSAEVHLWHGGKTRTSPSRSVSVSPKPSLTETPGSIRKRGISRYLTTG